MQGMWYSSNTKHTFTSCTLD